MSAMPPAERRDPQRIERQLLFELSRPDPTAGRPLFTDFTPQLLITHPAEVKVAHSALLALFSELMAEAAAAEKLRPDADPRRAAAMTTQTLRPAQCCCRRQPVASTSPTPLNGGWARPDELNTAFTVPHCQQRAA